jgi:hypothetical protein
VKWVTRRDVGIDRMACAWLIQRFVDPRAEFVFAAPDKIAAADAEPFDVPGVRLSHHGGHSTFHTLVHEFELTDAALDRIARIVDEADMPQEVTLEPAAPGLDLICRGLRRSAKDDGAAISTGRIIFDALYAELGHAAGRK